MLLVVVSTGFAIKPSVALSRKASGLHTNHCESSSKSVFVDSLIVFALSELLRNRCNQSF